MDFEISIDLYEIQEGYSIYSSDESSYLGTTNSSLLRTSPIEAWIEPFLLNVTFPFNGPGQ